MNRVRMSFEILKHGLALLGRNRKLLIFPLLNLAAVVGLVILFVVAVGSAAEPSGFREAFGGFMRELGSGETRTRVLFLLALLPVYIAILVIATFLNVAFVNEILKAFNGKPVSVIAGFRCASTRIGAILAWSLLAGLVGVIVQSIGELLGKISAFGRLAAAFVGLSWSVASVFAIPVLIRDKNRYNPISFLRSSAGLIRGTWGEGLIGLAGLSAAGWLVFAGAIAIGVGAFIASLSFDVEALARIGAAVLVVCSILGVLALALQLAARKVFLCGLYTYAAEGVVPAPFDEETFTGVWRVREKR